MYVRDNNIRGRQSYVTREGHRYEEFIRDLLMSDEQIAVRAVIAKGTNAEKRSELKLDEDYSVQLDLLRVLYDSNGVKACLLLDNDLLIYSKVQKHLVCVISVKKSFRERGAETAYWMLKKRQSNKPFKYILATPDNDKELFNPDKPTQRRKWRLILTAEMDGVFIVKEEQDHEYEEENFKVGRKHLIEFVKTLL